MITGLRWDINPQHTVRVSYTLDHAKHRQTGEVGFVSGSGEPLNMFPVDNPIVDGRGNILQKRDRKSFAILNQVAGEYRGLFLDDTLTVNVGLRMPFFKRKLDNRCFTTSASGFVDCFAGDAAVEAAYAIAFPNVQGPQKRTFKYDKLLPNIGFVYDFTPQISAFASYTKGLSVPSTDNLYNSFFFAPDRDEAKPDPETTDSFDGGVRYRSGKIQAQASIWYTHFKDRQAQAFDPELNVSVFRCAPRTRWPLAVELLEKHPESTQVFVPMNARRYLAVVALGGDRPDLATLAAFVATGAQGISYHAGVWHHPMIALDSEVDFTCLVWEDGSPGDCTVVHYREDERVEVVVVEP